MKNSMIKLSQRKNSRDCNEYKSCEKNGKYKKHVVQITSVLKKKNWKDQRKKLEKKIKRKNKTNQRTTETHEVVVTIKNTEWGSGFSFCFEN